jgi:uncharacterized radical SAM superfamily Fe-S cluster-containing enzyme
MRSASSDARCAISGSLTSISSQGSKSITKEEINSFVDQLSYLMPKGTILNFAGGEPFLRKDMIDLIRHASTQRVLHSGGHQRMAHRF